MSKDQLLGNEKISRLLIKLSVPATVSMFVNALYNLVDTIFIGGIGYLGISGLTILFPQMLVAALADRSGASSIISRLKGEITSRRRQPGTPSSSSVYWA